MKFKLKRFIACFLALVMVLTGVQLTNFVKANADIGYAYVDEVQIPTKSLLVWSFEKFTPDVVWESYDAMTLNSDYVEIDDFYQKEWVRNQHDAKTSATYEKAMYYSNKVGIGTKLRNSSGVDINTLGYTPNVTYKQIGTLEDSGKVTVVDLKVTLKDWTIKENTTYGNDSFVMFSVCVPTDPKDTLSDKTAIGVWLSSTVTEVEVQYDFINHETGELIGVNGTFTQKDLDYKQYFAYNNTVSNMNQVYISNEGKEYGNFTEGENKHLRFTEFTEDGEDWVKVEASSKGTHPDEDYYHAGNVTCMFGGEEDANGNLKTTSSVLFKFGGPGEDKFGHYYFGIEPSAIATYSAPTPYKYVIDYEGDVIESVSDEAYYTDGKTEVTYVIDVYVPRSLTANYNSFSISDTLNEVFKTQGKKVNIYRDSNYAIDGTVGSGTNVNLWFDFTLNDNSRDIIVTASDDTIAENYSREFFGHSYQVVVTAELDNSILEVAADRNIIGYENGYYVIPNKATCTAGVFNINENPDKPDDDYQEIPADSNEAHVYYAEPELDIEKWVSAYTNGSWSAYAEEVKVVEGQQVRFKVLATNTNSLAQVVNLKVRDVVPSDIKVISITSKGFKDGKYISLGSLTTQSVYTYKGLLGSGSINTSNKTATGDYIEVIIEGTVQNSGTIKNTAYTSHAYDPTEISDSATLTSDVFIPKLEVKKSFSKDKIAVNNTATVTIEISQLEQEGGAEANKSLYIYNIEDIMEVYSDEDDQYMTSDYFTATGELPIITHFSANGVAKRVTLGNSAFWDTANGVNGSMEGTKKLYFVAEEFEDYIELAYGDKLIIEYDVVAKAVPDTERYGYYKITYNTPNKNTVEVLAEDGEGYYTSAKADDTLDVVYPSINVKKVSDKEIYDIEESAHYTVTLSQTKEDVSADVVYVDYFIDSHFQYYSFTDYWWSNISKSTVIKDSLGNDITSNFDIQMVDSSSTLIPEEHRNIAYGKVLLVSQKEGYEFELTYGNDYTIEYDVPIGYGMVLDAGRSNTNRAVLAIPSLDMQSTDDNTIIAYNPSVTIDKTVVEYNGSNVDSTILKNLNFQDEIVVDEGSTVWYRLIVNQYSALGVVEELSVQDVAPEGINLNKDTGIYILDHEGNDITDVYNTSILLANDEATDYTRAGVSAKWSYNPYIEIYYKAKVNNGTDGQVLINTATAGTYYANDVSDTATVKVLNPVLNIDKVSDKSQYTVGDTGHYTITITQVKEGAVAENIYSSDTIQDGASVKTSTIKATLYKSGSSVGESIEVDYDSFSSSLDSTDDSRYYEFYLGGMNATSDEIPDLAYGDKLVIEYDAVYNKVGTVKNKADATALRANWVEDENIVTVKDKNTEIAIDKYVNRNYFNVNEKPWYTLEIINVNEDNVAENISIVDYSDIGLEFDLDSIWVYVDGEYVTPANEPTVTQVYKDGKLMNKLTIENTGIDLAYGQLLMVEYETTAVKEGVINNTAYTSANNAPEVSDSDKITVIEPLVNVRITKRIKVDDIHFGHGNPIFIINLKGTDNYGKTVNLNKVVEFTEEYVEVNTVGDYVEMSVVFEDLIRGKYTASESDVIRYKLSSIENYNMGTVNKTNGTILFNMTYSGNNTTAYATFVNDKYEWQGYSDTSRVTNKFNIDFE